MWLTSPQPKRLGYLPSALWSTKLSLDPAGSRGVPGHCLRCSPEIQEMDGTCVLREGVLVLTSQEEISRLWHSFDKAGRQM